MQLRYAIASVLLASLFGLPSRAPAQNLESWASNESARLQEEANSGSLNQQQASRLENRDAQIQSQEEQLLNNQNGNLRPRQRMRLAEEMARLNERSRLDRHENAVAPGGSAFSRSLGNVQNAVTPGANQLNTRQYANPNLPGTASVPPTFRREGARENRRLASPGWTR
jgi:hypothetical protein